MTIEMCAKFKDHYEILGLDYGASQDEIKKAWKKKMKLCHPDRFAHSDEEGKTRATDMAKQVNEAYHTLKDDDSRKEYDLQYALKHGLEPPPGAAVYQQGGPSDAVYSSSSSSARDHVYEPVDIEGEETVVIAKPSQPAKKKAKPPPKEPESLGIINAGIATIVVSILLIIFVMPFFLPGMPNVIMMVLGDGEDNGGEENETLDSDYDGFEDSVDIYPYGNGVLAVNITYFNVLSFPEGVDTVNPYFVIYVQCLGFRRNTTSEIFYDSDELVSPVSEIFDIPDNTYKVRITLEVYSQQPTKEFDEPIDIKDTDYYFSPDVIYINELKQGRMVLRGDGSEDGREDELDGYVFYTVDLMGAY